MMMMMMMRQGRQKKRMKDDIREWTGLDFGRSQRAVENREKMEETGCKVERDRSRLRRYGQVVTICDWYGPLLQSFCHHL